MPNYKTGKAKKYSYDSFKKSASFTKGGMKARSRGRGGGKRTKMSKKY